MAQADLLLKLVKASTQRNHEQVRRVIEALAAEECAKNHTILADRLLTQLQGGGNGHAPSTQPGHSVRQQARCWRKSSRSAV